MIEYYVCVCTRNLYQLYLPKKWSRNQIVTEQHHEHVVQVSYIPFAYTSYLHA